MAAAPTDQERAANYRRRAKELRAVADATGHADSGAILRRLADQHDAMADKIEARMRQLQKPDSN
jgi:hypothetical protein